jgi:hypothetical protein
MAEARCVTAPYSHVFAQARDCFIQRHDAAISAADYGFDAAPSRYFRFYDRIGNVAGYSKYSLRKV